MSIHFSFACVIGRQGQPNVPMEPIQEIPQVLGPTGDILIRIVEILHAKSDGGFRNQLHESYRSRLRYHGWVKGRFGPHYRKQQGWLNVVLLSRTDNCLLKFTIPHTTVIPSLAENCCDRLVHRYACGTHQSYWTDVPIDLHIGKNKRRPSCHQYHDCAGGRSYGAVVAELPVT